LPPALREALIQRHQHFEVVCYETGTGGYFRRHQYNVTPDA